MTERNSMPPDPIARAEVDDIEILDRWFISGPEMFPDLSEEPDVFRPATTLAANGDLVMAVNLGTDGRPGGEIRVARSRDRGRTWSPAVRLPVESAFGSAGALSSQRGLATLPDGTLLLPFNDSLNISEFNNRVAKLYLTRSSDHGESWGTPEKVKLPVPLREAWVGGSQIIAMEDGTLILPIWGASKLGNHWRTQPVAWQTGVLRSFDGGSTWPDYREIFHDPHNPPQYPPVFWTKYPSGSNEVALQRLPDGRLLAAVRFATGIGESGAQLYLAYSADQGATWTAPVPSGLQAETHTFHQSSVAAERLLMGYRELDYDGRRTGYSAIRASWDAGLTWGEETHVQPPPGSGAHWESSGEFAFLPLEENRTLAVFQAKLDSLPFRIMANVVEERSIIEGGAPARDSLTLIIRRRDHIQWPWPYAMTRVEATPGTTVADIVSDAAAPLQIDEADGLLVVDADETVVPADASIGNLNIRHGQVLTVYSDVEGPDAALGFSDLDLHPATRPITCWGEAAPHAALALDYRARSLGIRIPNLNGQSLCAVELWARDEQSRLAPSSFRLWGSLDNVTFRELHGWSCVSRCDGGRLVHRFEELDVSEGYLKISHNQLDSDATFIIQRPRRDVVLEYR